MKRSGSARLGTRRRKKARGRWAPVTVTLAVRLVVASAVLAPALCSAQVRYMSVRTLKSPLPGLELISPSQTNGPAPTAVTAPRALIQATAVKPSLDKEELTRRVVAFQKQRAAEGSPSAQYELGLRYLTGDGVEKNPASARAWLKAAAQEGNTAAQRKLAELEAKK